MALDHFNAGLALENIISNLVSSGHRGTVSISAYGDTTKDHHLPSEGVKLNHFPAGVPFERFGPVRDVYIPRDYYSGKCNHFCAFLIMQCKCSELVDADWIRMYVELAVHRKHPDVSPVTMADQMAEEAMEHCFNCEPMRIREPKTTALIFAWGKMMLKDAGFEDVIAEDRTDQFVQVLRRELESVEKETEEFINDFSEEDYNDIVGG
ncbi:unnamed protein product [Arabis nemorensis]|uniref:phosphoethanolamine N-methyltransferase n=1 Tax=Arabis nemorensis TaxID=586526 RepID=A0A565CBG9_9BRAS|nr:unnamed protein product [Arabis nemorensis]